MEARNLTQTAKFDNELHSVLDDAKVDPKDCYQCGKCSAGCPVASDADMTPREVLRHLQLGQVDPVLKSNMPWLCAGCGMCLARCPQSVDLPNLMLACRRAGEAQGIKPIGEVARFNQLFVNGVREKGALRRSRPSHAFQPCNRPLPAGCIECTENGGARNDRSNQQGTGECR